jgi:hypothetical protein
MPDPAVRRPMFFIGGLDLEMAEILVILKTHGHKFVDAGLLWGAKASAYGNQISEAAVVGFVPVLIELEVDVDLPEEAIVIDHHGSRSGEPASLLRVLAMMSLSPTRRQELVAANDVSGFFGLKKARATDEEIDHILREERELVGFTQEMEEISVRAAEHAFYIPYKSTLTCVHLPFSRFAAAKAYLWLQGRKNMIFFAEDGSGEVEFQGDGAIVQAFVEKFASLKPWSGGAGLGKKRRYDAYVGMYMSDEQERFALQEFVRSKL